MRAVIAGITVTGTKTEWVDAADAMVATLNAVPALPGHTLALLIRHPCAVPDDDADPVARFSLHAITDASGTRPSEHVWLGDDLWVAGLEGTWGETSRTWARVLTKQATARGTRVIAAHRRHPTARWRHTLAVGKVSAAPVGPIPGGVTS